MNENSRDSHQTRQTLYILPKPNTISPSKNFHDLWIVFYARPGAGASDRLGTALLFTVIVRGIPRVQEESYDDAVTKFFTNFYASSYLSHQMVYLSGTVQKLMMFKMMKSRHIEQYCGRTTINQMWIMWRNCSIF